MFVTHPNAALASAPLMPFFLPARLFSAMSAVREKAAPTAHEPTHGKICPVGSVKLVGLESAYP
jgi:hypothetical protein